MRRFPWILCNQIEIVLFRWLQWILLQLIMYRKVILPPQMYTIEVFGGSFAGWVSIVVRLQKPKFQDFYKKQKRRSNHVSRCWTKWQHNLEIPVYLFKGTFTQCGQDGARRDVSSHSPRTALCADYVDAQLWTESTKGNFLNKLIEFILLVHGAESAFRVRLKI